MTGTTGIHVPCAMAFERHHIHLRAGDPNCLQGLLSIPPSVHLSYLSYNGDILSPNPHVSYTGFWCRSTARITGN